MHLCKLFTLKKSPKNALTPQLMLARRALNGVGSELEGEGTLATENTKKAQTIQRKSIVTFVVKTKYGINF